MSEINFHGTDPEIIFRKLSYIIAERLTREQAAKLKHQCVSEDILSGSESAEITRSSQLVDIILIRSTEQIKKFLNLVYQDPVNQSIKEKIHQQIEKRRAELELEPIPTQTQDIATNDLLETHESSQLLVETHNIEIDIINRQQDYQNQQNIFRTRELGRISKLRNCVCNRRMAIIGGLGGIACLLGLIALSFYAFSPNADNPTSTTPDVLSPTAKLSPALTKVATNIQQYDPFDQMIKTPTEVNSVKSLQHYKRGICKNSLTSVYINYAEEGKASSSLLGKIPCPENIRGLKLSGFIPLEHFHCLLSQLVNLIFLEVDVKYMCNMQLANFPSIHLTLPFLKNLNISSLFTECANFIEYFELVDAPSLQTLVLHDTEVFMNNKQFFDSLPKKFPNISHFSFNGGLCYNCEIRNKTWNLTALKWHIKHGHGSGSDSLKNLASQRNLQFIDSNVEVSVNDEIFSSSLKNIAVITLTVKLESNTLHASFFVQFSRLSQAHLKLKCNSDELNVTGLQRFIGPSKIELMQLSSECKIKASQLPCREYAYNFSNQLWVVEFRADRESQSCKNFWEG